MITDTDAPDPVGKARHRYKDLRPTQGINPSPENGRTQEEVSMKKSVFLSTLVATSVVAGAAFAGTLDDIKARVEAASGKEVPKVQYEVGEEVKVTDGAFANLTGRIDEIDPDRGKLKISVSIFGRFTPVELEYWQVQRMTE